METKAKLDREF